jgi:hypothetical protein
MLRAFAGPYAEDLGRKPDTREFLFALEGALRTTGRDLFADLEAHEVAAVKLTTKKAPKFRKFAVGDFFVVPLQGGEFAYGRIIGSDAAGTVIEVYRLRTRHPLTLGGLKQQARDLLVQTHVNGLLAFRPGRWPILGREPLPRNHPMPSFRLGSDEAWQVARGDKRWPADLEEVLRMEPMVCWDPETVEERIASGHPDVWPEFEEWQCRDFGDAYLKILREPDKLRQLFLESAEVTDAGLKYLARCRGLKTLRLFSRPVTDAGLRHLAKLTALEDLDLGRTRVTDAGLVHLHGLSNLKTLGLEETRVTDAGVAALNEWLPGAEIRR